MRIDRQWAHPASREDEVGWGVVYERPSEHVVNAAGKRDQKKRCEGEKAEEGSHHRVPQGSALRDEKRSGEQRADDDPRRVVYRSKRNDTGG